MESNNRNGQDENLPKTPRYRFREDEIDWDEMGKFGLGREFLVSRGYLEPMLRGYKTEQTVPVHLKFPNLELHADARLSFNRSPSGGVMLRMHGVKLHPELERPYLGHTFTEEEKRNLIETGNLGARVQVRSLDGRTNEAFISLDRTTNELCAMSASRVTIPESIKGVRLTDEQREALWNGRAVQVEGMTSTKGTKFSAVLQISADKRGIEFTFPRGARKELGSICGVQLTDEQREALKAGRAILVEKMRGGEGRFFSSFVRLDPETGIPRFTKYNPDTPAGHREIVVPRVIGGKALTERQRDLLREGKSVGTYGISNNGGEVFDALVRLDTETGELSYRREEVPDLKLDFDIPDRVMGVELDEVQKFDLAHGHPVAVVGMEPAADGRRFGYVRADAVHSALEFYSDRKAAIEGLKPDHVLKAGVSGQARVGNTPEPEQAQTRKRNKGMKM